MKAAARVARSKEFRQLLMQIPLTEAAMKKAWNWAGFLPPEKREWLRARCRRAARDGEVNPGKVHSGRSDGSDTERHSVLQHRESAKSAGLRAAGAFCRWNETGRTMAAVCRLSLRPLKYTRTGENDKLACLVNASLFA